VKGGDVNTEQVARFPLEVVLEQASRVRVAVDDQDLIRPTGAKKIRAADRCLIG